MKNFYKPGFIALFIALTMTVILPASCKKETTCYANITVLDATTNAPVVGATVMLDCSTCPTQSTLQTDQTTTDASGRAAFTFKYEAVLDIHVTLGSRTATGVVKLEAGKTVEKEVSLP
jgi:hypothetical protein